MMEEERVKSLLIEQAAALQKLKQDNIAALPVFLYISYKAALFYLHGGEIYQRNDFFHYPLKEWNWEPIQNGCEQILKTCAGLSPDYPIKNLAANDMRNLFELFHFSKISAEATEGAVCRMDFVHKMDRRPFSVYYDGSNSGENDPHVYLSVFFNDHIVTLNENTESGVIKIYTGDGSVGVGAEYAFVRNRYPEYDVKRQRLHKMKLEGKETMVDILEITGKDEAKELIFDISEFYGKI